MKKGTIAETLSRRFQDDGHVWETESGEWWGDVLAQYIWDAIPVVPVSDRDTAEGRADERVVYVFHDGSAMVDAGGLWDIVRWERDRWIIDAAGIAFAPDSIDRRRLADFMSGK